jgi:aromatic ring-opening dioxygenase LigB subunit
MLELARQVRNLHPDTIVIATPHNLRLWKSISIVFSENSTGKLQSESLRNRNEITLSVKCDTKFARELYGRAKDAHLPVVGANYGTFEGPASDLPIDRSVLIPLWFIMEGGKHKKQVKKPAVVIVSPSREIPIRYNVAFGREIAKLAQDQTRRKIVFVASADQAHTHRKDDPYGFHHSAQKFDQMAVKSIEGNDLDKVLKLDPQFIEDAKPDSVWQLAILHGILQECNLKPKLFSYQVQTYFGMICAGYSRA